jgi:MFS family permease
MARAAGIAQNPDVPAPLERAATGTFRALRRYNYRTWAVGAAISNVGTWMQRVAQDWLVLTQLTDNNATAVGVVMALQFGPQAVLLPLTGFAADRFDRRKLLFATQAAMGTLALGLGLLTITGLVELWHVYVFALLLGCVTAFDAPARQTFVSDLVPERELSNAVALNSTSFNAARTVGPAVAGAVIASVGTGWAFLANAGSFAAVLIALGLLRVGELRSQHRAVHAAGGFADGFRYVWGRPDLKAILFMMFLIGTFGLNFPIYISTMSVSVFGEGAGRYGLLTSMMAVGSVAGALLAARRARPRIGPARGGALAELWSLRHRARRRGPCGSDLQHHRERRDPALDRSAHARARDGDLPRDRDGRDADRRAHRGLHRGHVRAALRARLRRVSWLRGGARRGALPRQVS